MSLSPGTSLGHYDVTSLLGEGGMGQVWQATDTQLNRQVALKILPDAFADDPDRLARFTREAHILASLNHPNIAAIYGIEEAEGTRALVLELVEGPTLADRIAHGPVPIDEALPIAKQIAEALEAAHEAGVIHRDLKPANIKVREDGTVKVLDFGLAKALDPNPEGDPSQSPTLTAAATQMGVIMGTAAYMSPEQARGKVVDKRSDIWAFGCVLFEMLTGRRVFEAGDVSEVLALVLVKDVELTSVPTDVPTSIRTLLGRCLTKEPRDRLRDIGEARVVLRDSCGAAPIQAAPGAAPQAAEGGAWTQRTTMAIVATVVVTALVTGLAVWSARPEDPRPVSRVSYQLPEGQQFHNANPGVLAVSPDGRHFAYNTTDGLYLRSMGAFEPRILTETEGGGIALPFFSPDGQSIAYFELTGSLKRLALSGGAPVVITEGVLVSGSGTWTSDGMIYVATREGILRVPANGGTPELVVPAEEAEWVDVPQLLPDGETLIFSVAVAGRGVSSRWDDARIVAASLATGERTTILTGGSDARYLPTGHLVYALGTGLFAVGFDADSLTVGAGPVLMIDGVFRTGRGPAASANYAVSDDGTLFYVSGRGSSAGPLVWVERDGTAEVITTVPPNLYTTPRLSPDGDRVLVVAEGDAWIYDLASGRESRVTSDGLTGSYAGWAPSGNHVTYTSGRDTGTVNVWRQAADGSGAAERLTTLDGNVHFDSWAIDGRMFAAHHHLRDATNLLMVAFDDAPGEPEVWLDRPYAETDAVFSPDGRFVAYRSAQTGGNQIYIRPFPGPGGQTPVSVDGGVEPVWGRNGELFYRRETDYAMMAVEVSTAPSLSIGPPTMLFPGSPNPGGSPRPRYSVTADGRRFLMTADLLAFGEEGAGTAPHVNIVFNWLEELKARVPVP